MSIKEITLQLVLKFLKDKGYTESYLNLQLQSKINLKEHAKQIQFFKKILLKGDFNQAVQFIWTFEQKIPNQTLKKLTLQIYKQKLYQLLQNPQQTELRNLFEKQIINVCSQQQYQHLFTLLTCRSVKQIAGMDGWSPIKGRHNCFQQIQPYLSNFFNTSLYQKTTIKEPSFTLEDAIQSFIAAEQKVQQRMQKSQNSIKPIGSIRNSTDKQSIEIRPPKNQQQFKNSKLDISNQSRNIKAAPYLNINANPNSSNVSNNTIANSSKTKGSLNQIDYKRQLQQLEMAQSKIQKNLIQQKNQKNNIDQQNQEINNLQTSNFSKKYNAFVGNINAENFNKSKDESRFAKKIKIEDLEDESSQYRNLRQKQKQRLKQNQKQKQKQKQKNKNKKIPLYMKYTQKQANDSEVFQQQVKKNIAYLEQNNSIVYKEDQNENFTFSNGAQESGINEKNRKVIKLASFSDPKAIRTCQFSPSGSLFAFGTNSSYLKIYDVEELFEQNIFKQMGACCQIPQLHAKSIYCLDWSSNQKSIATCSNDLTIKITDFQDNFNFSNYKTNVIGRHQSSVRMVKFNSLQTKLVSCGDDSLIKIWDIGKIKKCTILKGHTQTISAFKFGVNEEDNILYSVSKDCTLRKWDIRQSQCISISPVHDCQLTYIANNIDRIVVSDKAGNVLFYNEQLQLQNVVKIHDEEIRSIDGTNYDDLLLTASFDGHVCIFSQKNKQLPNYFQHNQKLDDKVVFATFLNSPQYHGFASTSTMGICNIFSYQ